jgi:hypothetical protein
MAAFAFAATACGAAAPATLAGVGVASLPPPAAGLVLLPPVAVEFALLPLVAAALALEFAPEFVLAGDGASEAPVWPEGPGLEAGFWAADAGAADAGGLGAGASGLVAVASRRVANRGVFASCTVTGACCR